MESTGGPSGGLDRLFDDALQNPDTPESASATAVAEPSPGPTIVARRVESSREIVLRARDEFGAKTNAMERVFREDDYLAKNFRNRGTTDDGRSCLLIAITREPGAFGPLNRKRMPVRKPQEVYDELFGLSDYSLAALTVRGKLAVNNPLVERLLSFMNGEERDRYVNNVVATLTRIGETGDYSQTWLGNINTLRYYVQNRPIFGVQPSPQPAAPESAGGLGQLRPEQIADVLKLWLEEDRQAGIQPAVASASLQQTAREHPEIIADVLRIWLEEDRRGQRPAIAAGRDSVIPAISEAESRRLGEIIEEARRERIRRSRGAAEEGAIEAGGAGVPPGQPPEGPAPELVPPAPEPTPAVRAVERVGFWGKPWRELVLGAGLGIAVRRGLTVSLMGFGFGGLPYAVFLGGTSGAIVRSIQEVGRQYAEKQRALGSTETNAAKALFKGRFRQLVPDDRGRVAHEFRKGAIWGGIGSFIGFEFAEYVATHPEEVMNWGPVRALGGIRDWISSLRAPELGQPVGPEIVPPAPEQVAPPPPAESAPATPSAPQAPPAVPQAPVVPQAPPAEVGHPAGVAPEAPTTPAAPAQPAVPPPPPTEVVPPVVPLSPIQENILKLPAVVEIARGSNPWQVSHDLLVQTLGGHEPTNTQILEVDKALSRASKVAVPNWGISGAGFTLDTKLPVGYNLNIDDSVRAAIAHASGVDLPHTPQVPVTPQVSAFVPAQAAPTHIDVSYNLPPHDQVAGVVQSVDHPAVDTTGIKDFTLIKDQVIGEAIKSGQQFLPRSGETYGAAVSHYFGFDFDKLNGSQVQSLYLRELTAANYNPISEAFKRTNPGVAFPSFGELMSLFDRAESGDLNALHELKRIYSGISSGTPLGELRVGGPQFLEKIRKLLKG